MMKKNAQTQEVVYWIIFAAVLFLLFLFIAKAIAPVIMNWAEGLPEPVPDEVYIDYSGKPDNYADTDNCVPIAQMGSQRLRETANFRTILYVAIRSYPGGLVVEKFVKNALEENEDIRTLSIKTIISRSELGEYKEKENSLFYQTRDGIIKLYTFWSTLTPQATTKITLYSHPIGIIRNDRLHIYEKAFENEQNNLQYIPYEELELIDNSRLQGTIFCKPQGKFFPSKSMIAYVDGDKIKIRQNNKYQYTDLMFGKKLNPNSELEAQTIYFQGILNKCDFFGIFGKGNEVGSIQNGKIIFNQNFLAENAFAQTLNNLKIELRTFVSSEEEGDTGFRYVIVK